MTLEYIFPLWGELSSKSWVGSERHVASIIAKDFRGTLTMVFIPSRYLFYYVHMIASFFVLLNMLLAIIVDAYIEVKRSASLADNLFADMAKHVR